MENEAEYMVFCQEIDISSGSLPLPLLRQAVAESPIVGRKLQDIGLVRDGERILLKLYYSWGGEENQE